MCSLPRRGMPPLAGLSSFCPGSWSAVQGLCGGTTAMPGVWWDTRARSCLTASCLIAGFGEECESRVNLG